MEPEDNIDNSVQASQSLVSPLSLEESNVGVPQEFSNKDHFNALSHQIINGDGVREQLQKLSPSQQLHVLQTKDDKGWNLLLLSIRHENLPGFKDIVNQILDLGHQDIISSSRDENGNNILHLAVKRDNHEIMMAVWDNVSQFAQQTITDLIISPNNEDTNAFSLTLASKDTPTWLGHLFLSNIGFNDKGISNLWYQDGAGMNTISRCLQFRHYTVMYELVKGIAKYQKAVLKTIFVELTGQMDESCDAQSGEREYCLMEMLIKHRDGTNDRLIDDIASIYLVDSFDSLAVASNEAQEHFNTLVGPLQDTNECILSLLISADCHFLMEKLQKTVQFKQIFYRELDNQQGSFSEEHLKSQPMTARMLSVLNAPPSKHFFSLINRTKARSLSLFIFTEKHTKSKDYRSGGAEECYNLRDAFRNDLGFDCLVFSGESKIWRWKECLEWVADQLQPRKDQISLLFMAVFSHGEEGVLYDSDGGPLAINFLLQLVDKYRYPHIPLAFFIQACRELPEIGHPPPIRVPRYSVLIRPCGAEEKCVRSVYADEFAAQIRAGVTNVKDIHDNVTDHITNHIRIDVRQQAPELTTRLLKPQLELA